MKTTLTTLLIIALFLLGCAETPVSPVTNNDDPSYQLFKLPKKSGGAAGTIFTVTKTIDGMIGEQIILDKSYVAEDGHTVDIYAKLIVKENSYQDFAAITLTIDDDVAAVSFTPAMVFDKPLELSLTFEGLDLEGLGLTTGDYDFVFIDDDENIEIVAYNAIHIDESLGKIWVTEAKLPHFSRYAFVH